MKYEDGEYHNKEIEESVKAGAKEIDIVISRRHVLSQDWQALYDEMKAFREACGGFIDARWLSVDEWSLCCKKSRGKCVSVRSMR